MPKTDAPKIGTKKQLTKKEKIIKFDVTITETLQRVVTIEADTPEEAKEIAEDRWSEGYIVLESDDFVEVDFSCD